MAGAKAIEPANECLLTSAITKSMADIKVKESKNSEAISRESGMKKNARTANSFISPAPTPARKKSGARINTAKPVIGCISLCVATLSESSKRKVIESARLEMR